MPIRLRLALWSGAILAAGLLGFSALIYLLAGHTLRASADTTIVGRARRVDALLITTPSEHLTSQERRARFARIAQVFSSSGVAVLLLDDRGAIVAQSQGMDLPPPCCAARTALRFQPVTRLAPDSFYERQVGRDPFRAFVLRRSAPGVVRYVVVGHSIQDIEHTLRTLLTLLIAGSAICLGLVCAAAWFLARRALAPIAAITNTAARIAESGDFVDRVHGSARNDEVGRLAATFNTMLNRLEELHAAQRRFVSDASHELRAPLTTIRGNAELLLLDPLAPPDERDDALRDIAEEAARLTRLVEGLLALARGDARQRFRPQPVRLHDLLLSACQAMAERPRCPEVTLTRNDPALVHADPDRLEQLLIILLDNACKYTPPDGHVYCSLEADARWVALTVRDTGAGIHPDDLPHIFERFYRADRARTHEWPTNGDAPAGTGGVPGTGLGLAIARQIVEEANGAISVTSQVGAGATFLVRLPRYVPGHALPRQGAGARETVADSSHT